MATRPDSGYAACVEVPDHHFAIAAAGCVIGMRMLRKPFTRNGAHAVARLTDAGMVTLDRNGGG